MTLTKFNPSTTSPLNSFLEDFFGRDSQEMSHNRNLNTPAVNIRETENGFDVEVAAPGLAREDFKIELKHNKLSVSASKETKTATSTDETTVEKPVKGRYYRKEFSYGAFSRSFTLPHTVDRESIAASYESGVLKLHIPKKEEVITSRLIEIG